MSLESHPPPCKSCANRDALSIACPAKNDDSGSLTHKKIALRSHYRRFLPQLGLFFCQFCLNFTSTGEAVEKVILFSCAGFVIRHDRVRGFQPRADCKSAPPIRRDFKFRRTKQQIVATAISLSPIYGGRGGLPAARRVPAMCKNQSAHPDRRQDMPIE